MIYHSDSFFFHLEAASFVNGATEKAGKSILKYIQQNAHCRERK
jgi:hypothetical protein